MTLLQLAYFVALADVRNFTRAAERCGVAQPTLSRQIQALEAELGAALVERGRSGARGELALTPAGEAVLPAARRMLADSEDARTAVAELIGLRSGRVRVGATPSLCLGLLADVLRLFHEQHPEIHLELSENGSQLLVRDLLRGELDVALVIVPPSGLDPALSIKPLLRERLSVASARADSTPNRRGSMTLAELSRHELVMFRQGYDLREVTLRAYRDAGLSPKFAVEGGEMDAVLRLVENDTGVAVVPDLVFAGRPRLRRTTLLPPLYRTVALAQRADVATTHAALAFHDMLLSYVRTMPAIGSVDADVTVLHRQ
ncbi:LysR substrate-binding domain-containing protein [Pseudonocardia eucalypti]|uniref:LysR substrate-binding domain-containing protein n=1 Tax=Pseudonocardia eucalypti TaxID=648755 RepID=A0ABP9R5L0_9PSEU|nr:DNA-binding transcriptional LysR family regulator [Pseudonocardia eucalypti]